MPRVVSLRDPLPMNAGAAVVAFHTELQNQLIRFYNQHPGSSQTAAARALEQSTTVVSNHCKPLLDTGVLVDAAPPGVGNVHSYTVDNDRLDEIHDALKRYHRGGPDAPLAAPGA